MPGIVPHLQLLMFLYRARGYAMHLSEVTAAAISLQSQSDLSIAAADNILFDLPYNEERYQKTLEVCALLSDLKILEDGDMSEIGERGVSISPFSYRIVLTFSPG